MTCFILTCKSVSILGAKEEPRLQSTKVIEKFVFEACIAIRMKLSSFFDRLELVDQFDDATGSQLDECVNAMRAETGYQNTLTGNIAC